MIVECRICHSDKLQHLGLVDTTELFRCTECGVVIADCPEPIAGFYEDSYIAGGKFGYDYGTQEQAGIYIGSAEKRRCKKLAKYERIIEVGAGAGQFQAILNRLGLDAIGVERSSSMRRSAKEFYDVDLRGEVRDIVENEKSTEYCLSMMEVIEHIADPIEFMTNLLREFGTPPKAIYMTSPNADAIKTLGLGWEQVKPPEHLILYGVSGFQYLAGRLGYRVTDVVHYQSVFLNWAQSIFGRRADRKVPILWTITSSLRAIDPVVCRVLPGRFSTGLEVLFSRDD